MTHSKETTLACRRCGSGKLLEPVIIEPGCDYVPVKCSTCGFTGRRVNLIVMPESGESWKGVV